MLAPDAIEPIVAWRVWLLSGGDPRPRRLESVVHACLWPAREELVARCMTTSGQPSGDHFAPHGGCRCGIYGAASLGSLLSYVGFPYRRDDRLRIVGLVCLWGRVVQHAQGWRASHAYPARIWLPHAGVSARSRAGWERTAFELASYGVPVHPVPQGRAEAVLAGVRRELAPLGLEPLAV